MGIKRWIREYTKPKGFLSKTLTMEGMRICWSTSRQVDGSNGMLHYGYKVLEPGAYLILRIVVLKPKPCKGGGYVGRRVDTSTEVIECCINCWSRVHTNVPNPKGNRSKALTHSTIIIYGQCQR